MTTEHLAETDETMGDQVQREAALGSLFAEVCTRHPERIALTLGAESITYGELDRWANRLATELRSAGAGRGTFVAICLPRGFAMIAAMLGVVKCGAAYLPLDAGYPVARIEETIADAKPVAVLTDREWSGRLGEATARCLDVDEMVGTGCDDAVFGEVDASDAAYVIYTSGSTGQPKGVLVSHRNVTRLLRETERWFHFDSNDVWTLFHSFAFDFSVWEIWGCLLSGGRLVIVPFAVSRSPDEFHALLAAERVTVLNQTPSAFALLDQADALAQPDELSLRIVIFGGEALTLGTLRGWFQRHGDSHPALVNMYGITETTVHVTHRRLLAADADETDSLIGEPIGDLQLYLLDEQLRPVADGEEGEICIGGAGVAMGYLNRPELSAERFIADPFGGDGARLYRSGDLARRRADGELAYLGRHDGQVKINGFRVELGEIEAALIAHPAVLQGCVFARADKSVGARLIAYYVAQDGSEPPTRELSAFLGARLPAHMMPAFYQRLALFPLTPNGKVDRAMLPAPYTGTMVEADGIMEGASAIEDRIADIWRRVLRVGQVLLSDNFFDVGGTSLLLIAVRTGLQEQLGRQIPVTWMFECPTIEALARRLSEPMSEGTHRAAAIEDNARRQRLAFDRMRMKRGAKS